MTRHTLLGSLLLVLAAGVGFALPVPKAVTPPKAPAGLTQELVFFTADGPVRVRLTVALGGRSPEVAWAAALDGLFAFCDRDNNGTLDANERRMFAGGRGGYERLLLVEGFLINNPGSRPVIFAEANGKVDAAGFRDGFRISGQGPVTVNPQAPRPDSQALTDVLFKLLDTDKDGKLSADELRVARVRLAALDVDEDELLTPDELLGRFQNLMYGAFAVVEFAGDLNGRANLNQPPSLPELYTAPAGTAVTARDILALRDKDKDGSLTPAELGCDPKWVAEHDADGDGKLDADELAAWLRRGPDLDLTADLPDPRTGRGFLRGAFTTGEGSPNIGIGKSRFAGRAKASPDGGVALDLRDARFKFALDTSGVSARQQRKAAAELLVAGFDALGGEKGPVEKQKFYESVEYNGAAALIEFADADNDGKLTRAEVHRAAAVGGLLANCRAVVTVADQGRGLFELLDRDGDGRLSPRELNAAAGLIAGLDRDGDGKLARAELPRGYTITVAGGSIEAGRNDLAIDTFTFVYGGSRPVVVTRPAEDVPEWFRAADRNGDGDVSAAEFPGPPALFKKIDADGDGLISAEEARAFEKARAGRK